MKKKLKILGISGSPREGKTNFMLRSVLDAAERDYELILLKDEKIAPCTACGGCFHTHKCTVKDGMNIIYDKLSKADIIVFACPTYFANVPALMKNFMDRCLPLYLSEKLKGKKTVLLVNGNFKKGEVKFLDGFDVDEAVKDPAKKRELEKPVRRCLDILRFFCADHMKMEIMGSIAMIAGDSGSKNRRLIELGKKLVFWI